MDWDAGFSKVNITPRESIWLHGWAFRTKPSCGVSQEIFAKTVALKDAAGCVFAWVTVDLLGFSRTLADRLAAAIEAKHGIARSRLILCASHNHSGPAIEDLLPLYMELSREDANKVTRYTEWLEARIMESVELALGDLAPAELHFSQGFAGFGVNRRRAREGLRGLPTVVDQDVPVLKITSPDGKTRGVLFGYACHTTTCDTGTVHGDYAGYAQQYLEEQNPGMTALFVLGCAGDINPMPRHDQKLMEAYGYILAKAVQDALAGTMTPVRGALKTAFARPRIPIQGVPTRAELTAALPAAEGIEKRAIEYFLSILDRGEEIPRDCEYPIQVWQFGDGLKILALAGEPVADYSLRLKNIHGWETTWVCGYHDVLVAYIPSLRVLTEGGYEGGSGMREYQLPAPFSPKIEDIIVETVSALVRETQ